VEKEVWVHGTPADAWERYEEIKRTEVGWFFIEFPIEKRRDEHLIVVHVAEVAL
jgi:hypothetical protein